MIILRRHGSDQTSSVIEEIIIDVQETDQKQSHPCLHRTSSVEELSAVDEGITASDSEHSLAIIAITIVTIIILRDRGREEECLFVLLLFSFSPIFPIFLFCFCVHFLPSPPLLGSSELRDESPSATESRLRVQEKIEAEKTSVPVQSQPVLLPRLGFVLHEEELPETERRSSR